MGDPYRFYLSLLARALAGCRSVLDIGCGDHSPLCDLDTPPERTVGVDGHQESLDRAADGCHTMLKRMDIRLIAEEFGPSSFDAVVALDVIEHFEKAEGWRLLHAMETVARHRVIVFTPNGFQRQGEFDDNPAQVHRSGWTVSDFKTSGYRVAGVRGWKPLRGAFAAPRLRPVRLGSRISAITQPWVTGRPGLAHQLLAVRDA